MVPWAGRVFSGFASVIGDGGATEWGAGISGETLVLTLGAEGVPSCGLPPCLPVLELFLELFGDGSLR
jgi:hypothetical protein